MVAVISMETLAEETEEDLEAEQSLRTPSAKSVDRGEYRLKEALDEWSTVACKEIDPNAVIPYEVIPQCSRIITYEEAYDIISKNVNVQQYANQIKPLKQRRGFKRLLHKLFGPRKLKLELQEERNLMFMLAMCKFDEECKHHEQMLQTIYRRLTGSTFDCPRFGGHWEQIGFQGNDPATDLRGCGLLGLLQLLYLTTHVDNDHVARDIFQLSLNQTQNFPFSIMGINMSKITLEALREECLNNACNDKNEVISVLNDFYVGTYLVMHISWTKHCANVKDTAFVLAEVTKFVKDSPSEVLANLYHYRRTGRHGTVCEEYFTIASDVTS